MIPRQLHAVLEQKMFRGKAILVTGPRQSGKTTLLRAIEGEAEPKVLYLNCDEPDIRGLLTEATSSALKHLIGNAKIILIDEAQRVKNIGLTMKIIIDTFPNIQLIATGSSALEFANEINEPLTGRKWEYRLLPMSTHELAGYHGWLEERRLLEQRLVYRMYPDVVINPGEEREILYNLTSSYLYKDIFTFQQIRKPEIIEKLLEALALQITDKVSYNELAQMIQADSDTVQRYLNLLENPLSSSACGLSAAMSATSSSEAGRSIFMTTTASAMRSLPIFHHLKHAWTSAHCGKISLSANEPSNCMPITNRPLNFSGVPNNSRKSIILKKLTAFYQPLNSNGTQEGKHVFPKHFSMRTQITPL